MPVKKSSISVNIFANVQYVEKDNPHLLALASAVMFTLIASKNMFELLSVRLREVGEELEEPLVNL